MENFNTKQRTCVLYTHFDLFSVYSKGIAAASYKNVIGKHNMFMRHSILTEIAGCPNIDFSLSNTLKIRTELPYSTRYACIKAHFNTGVLCDAEAMQLEKAAYFFFILSFSIQMQTESSVRVKKADWCVRVQCFVIIGIAIFLFLYVTFFIFIICSLNIPNECYCS